VEVSARFIVHACEQRTPEWYALRAGRLTGSAAKDMLAEIKSGEAAARRDLRYRLIAERLSGKPQDDGYANAAMQWGIDTESQARAAYEAMTGNIVEEVGFVSLSDVLAGCSPDGLVGGDTILSIKCPKTSTQIRYLREGRMPAEYIPQALCELWVTGRQHVDFFSYDPRLPEGLQMFLISYSRDQKLIDEFERKALAFLAEVDTEIASLMTVSNLSARLAQAVSA
jgi:putative phage-type endonuclease